MIHQRVLQFVVCVISGRHCDPLPELNTEPRPQNPCLSDATGAFGSMEENPDAAEVTVEFLYQISTLTLEGVTDDMLSSVERKMSDIVSEAFFDCRRRRNVRRQLQSPYSLTGLTSAPLDTVLEEVPCQISDVDNVPLYCVSVNGALTIGGDASTDLSSVAQLTKNVIRMEMEAGVLDSAHPLITKIQYRSDDPYTAITAPTVSPNDGAVPGFVDTTTMIWPTVATAAPPQPTPTTGFPIFFAPIPITSFAAPTQNPINSIVITERPASSPMVDWVNVFNTQRPTGSTLNGGDMPGFPSTTVPSATSEENPNGLFETGTNTIVTGAGGGEGEDGGGGGEGEQAGTEETSNETGPNDATGTPIETGTEVPGRNSTQGNSSGGLDGTGTTVEPGVSTGSPSGSGDPNNTTITPSDPNTPLLGDGNGSGNNETAVEGSPPAPTSSDGSTETGPTTPTTAASPGSTTNNSSSGEGRKFPWWFYLAAGGGGTLLMLSGGMGYLATRRRRQSREQQQPPKNEGSMEGDQSLDPVFEPRELS